MPCSKDRHTKIGSLSTFASVLCIFGCPLLVSPYRPCFIFNRLCHWEKFDFIIACSSSDIFHRDKVSLVLFTNLHIKLNINPLLRIPCIHFLSKYSVNTYKSLYCSATNSSSAQSSCQESRSRENFGRTSDIPGIKSSYFVHIHNVIYTSILVHMYAN